MEDLIKLLDIADPKRLKETINKIIEYYNTSQATLNDKVAITQGVENAGKIMAVNDEGKVMPRTGIDGKGLFILDIKDGNLVMYQEYAENVQFTIGSDGYMRATINE